jgi:hypothetical protein
MATSNELGAMAYNSYSPSTANEITTGAWVADTSGLTRTVSNGFSAAVYSDASGAVVIAFRGTDRLTNDFFVDDNDWLTGNVPSALGYYSSQVLEAIKLVADVQALHPGAAIQLTGHSLGGGLASLMAVYFDLPAVVFDPAPFAATARGMEWRTDPVTGNVLFDGANWYNDTDQYFEYGCPQGDSDLLISGALYDILETRGGDDRSYGGAGNDFIVPGEEDGYLGGGTDKYYEFYCNRRFLVDDASTRQSPMSWRHCARTKQVQADTGAE